MYDTVTEIRSLCRALIGRDELSHEGAYVPRVGLQQGIKVGALLAGDAEGRVGVVARPQLDNGHLGLPDDVTDGHLDVRHGRVRVQASHEHVVSHHRHDWHHPQPLAGPSPDGGLGALLLHLL